MPPILHHALRSLTVSTAFLSRLVCLLLILTLTGCAYDVEQRTTAMRQVESSESLVTISGRQYQQSELALIELVAPDFGAWIAAVDGEALSGFNKVSPDSVFLKPGSHTFRVTFKNISILGHTNLQPVADVQANVEAGHVYMPHNQGFDQGSMLASQDASFGILDYGTSFPRDCLTGQITKLKSAQVATFAVRQSLYQECISQNGYKDKYTYLPPEQYQ